MPATTFNPIAETQATSLKTESGKVLVELSNDRALILQRSARPLTQRFTELLTPRVIAAIAIATTLLIIIFGFGTGVVFSMCVSLGFLVFLSMRGSTQVGKAFLGSSPSYYQVSISPHTILDERRVQISDTGVFVIVGIEYRATVKSPIEVVKLGIVDVRDYLSRDLYTKIAEIAANATLEDKLKSMRQDLDQYATAISGDHLFQIEYVTFNVDGEGDVGKRLAEISTSRLQLDEERASQRLREEQRGYFQELLLSDTMLMAELMRPDADKMSIQDALNVRMEADRIDGEQKIQLLKLAIENGYMEQHRVEKDYPMFRDALRAAIGGITTGGDSRSKIESAKRTSVERDDLEKIEGGNQKTDDSL